MVRGEELAPGMERAGIPVATEPGVKGQVPVSGSSQLSAPTRCSLSRSRCFLLLFLTAKMTAQFHLITHSQIFFQPILING